MKRNCTGGSQRVYRDPNHPEADLGMFSKF